MSKTEPHTDAFVVGYIDPLDGKIKAASGDSDWLESFSLGDIVCVEQFLSEPVKDYWAEFND